MTDTGSHSGSARGSNGGCDGLTLTQAAARLGVAERTLRTYIKEGKVLAEKVIGSKGVAVYRVYLDDPVSDPAVDRLVDPAVVEDDPPADPLLDPNAEAFIRHIAQLEQTIMELSGRCGWLQSELQQTRARLEVAEQEVRLLKAPSAEIPQIPDPDPTPTPQRSGPEQNGFVRGAERPPRRPWWKFWQA